MNAEWRHCANATRNETEKKREGGPSIKQQARRRFRTSKTKKRETRANYRKVTAARSMSYLLGRNPHTGARPGETETSNNNNGCAPHHVLERSEGGAHSSSTHKLHRTTAAPNASSASGGNYSPGTLCGIYVLDQQRTRLDTHTSDRHPISQEP